jgi:hypothetical protein
MNKSKNIFLFLVLICAITFFYCETSFAYPPDQIIVQGYVASVEGSPLWLTRMGTWDTTVRIEDYDGSLLIDPPYSVDTRTFHNGAMETRFGDDRLKNLDYGGNIYPQLRLEVELPTDDRLISYRTVSAAFRLGAAPYAFTAFNQKGGSIEAYGSPAVKSRARSGTVDYFIAEMGGTSYGIRGQGVNFGSYGSGSIMGCAGYADGSNRYGLYGYTNKVLRTITSITTMTIDHPVALRGIGYGTGGIGIHASNASATKASLYAINRRGGTALTLGNMIQIRGGANSPLGVLTIPSTSTTYTVTNSRANADAIIMLTIQNGVDERVWVSDQRDGAFDITRTRMSPTSALEVGYLIIN